MKRSDQRKLRNLPEVDYREQAEESVEDPFDVASEEEVAPSDTEIDEQGLAQTSAAVDANTSTPFRLAPPRLVVPDLSANPTLELSLPSVDASVDIEAVAEITHSPDSTQEDFQSVATDVDQLSDDSDVLQSSVASGSQTETILPDRSPVTFVEPLVDGTDEAVALEINTDNAVVVDAEAEMAALELRKTAAQLQSAMFQIRELHESVDDLESLTKKEIVQMHDELKELRVQLHSLNSEIKLAADPTFDYDVEVQQLLTTSKQNLKTIKLKVSSFDKSEEKKQTDRDAAAEQERIRLQNERNAENEAKVNAFKRAVQEVQAMRVSLLKLYSIDGLSTDRNEILRREKEKGNIAVEFTRMRDLVNNLLIQTDVIPGKESQLSQLFDYISEIGDCKGKYENKVHTDLVENDLTEDKLKLAELTKIDIGKFSGKNGVGDDFYTFKTKFLKAYGNHPKNLMVEWLKNNHLESPAKEAVGSLDSIEEIWVRLKNNFGNTEQMLMYRFSTIDRLGGMFRRKGFKR